MASEAGNLWNSIDPNSRKDVTKKGTTPSRMKLFIKFNEFNEQWADVNLEVQAAFKKGARKINAL